MDGDRQAAVNGLGQQLLGHPLALRVTVPEQPGAGQRVVGVDDRTRTGLRGHDADGGDVVEAYGPVQGGEPEQPDGAADVRGLQPVVGVRQVDGGAAVVDGVGGAGQLVGELRRQAQARCGQIGRDRVHAAGERGPPQTVGVQGGEDPGPGRFRVGGADGVLRSMDEHELGPFDMSYVAYQRAFLNGKDAGSEIMPGLDPAEVFDGLSDTFARPGAGTRNHAGAACAGRSSPGGREIHPSLRSASPAAGRSASPVRPRAA